MDVKRNEQRSRYELMDGDELAGIADYRMDGGAAVFPHTEIAPERRGQGLGAVLVAGALDDVRAQGLTVIPACWYVAEFVRDHPEYQDLLAA